MSKIEMYTNVMWNLLSMVLLLSIINGILQYIIGGGIGDFVISMLVSVPLTMYLTGAFNKGSEVREIIDDIIKSFKQ